SDQPVEVVDLAVIRVEDGEERLTVGAESHARVTARVVHDQLRLVATLRADLVEVLAVLGVRGGVARGGHGEDDRVPVGRPCGVDVLARALAGPSGKTG